MSPPTDQQRRFVLHLESLKADDRRGRASLAALRRGLGKRLGDAAESYPLVVPWLPPQASPWDTEPYFLIASLYAWHQGSWNADASGRGSSNLGASLARLARDVDSGSLEGRFVALLNCHRDDLPEHLRHAVGLLKSKDVPVDWAQLLADVQHWGWESRSVQLEWARAYWGSEYGGDVSTVTSSSTEQPGVLDGHADR